jgi:hypothetical protein
VNWAPSNVLSGCTYPKNSVSKLDGTKASKETFGFACYLDPALIFGDFVPELRFRVKRVEFETILS